MWSISCVTKKQKETQQVRLKLKPLALGGASLLEVLTDCCVREVLKENQGGETVVVSVNSVIVNQLLSILKLITISLSKHTVDYFSTCEVHPHLWVVFSYKCASFQSQQRPVS